MGGQNLAKLGRRMDFLHRKHIKVIEKVRFWRLAMKVIFVGGCHLVGKPHGVSCGFVRLLWKRWRKINRNLHFDLIPYSVDWKSLLDSVKEALARRPDLIIINTQAGLVLPTWDRTLVRLGLRPKQEIDELRDNWAKTLVWQPKDKGKFYWQIKSLGILILGGHRENWNSIETLWQELSEEIEQAMVPVIIMTPTPARGEYFVRGVENLERFREMVLRYASCYRVCDVYPELKALNLDALWIDGQHLSKKGHMVVGDRLWHSIQEVEGEEKWLQSDNF